MLIYIYISYIFLLFNKNLLISCICQPCSKHLQIFAFLSLEITYEVDLLISFIFLMGEIKHPSQLILNQVHQNFSKLRIHQNYEHISGKSQNPHAPSYVALLTPLINPQNDGLVSVQCSTCADVQTPYSIQLRYMFYSAS